MRKEPSSILITGASSGIGAALALCYAGPGRFLALTGRNRDRLEAVAATCRAAGATVETGILDICDRYAVAEWVEQVDDRHAIDLVVANAGVAIGVAGGEDPDSVRRTFAINVEGILNTLEPLQPRLIARRRGQIGIVSSLASFRGFPGAAAYCATKAAGRVLGEGMRLDLAPHGVGVSVICPGFVRTPMTDVNPFPMPFLMEPDRAALIIRKGLARNRGRIVFPWPTFVVCWLLAALPPAWIDRLLRAAPRKP